MSYRRFAKPRHRRRSRFRREAARKDSPPADWSEAAARPRARACNHSPHHARDQSVERVDQTSDTPTGYRLRPVGFASNHTQDLSIFGMRLLIFYTAELLGGG